jgi:ankyrin repeat protein
MAAEEGNVAGVKEFLDSYASYKNKPLLNGFTLIYIATANNRLSVVKSLVEDINCSVNAQNQVSTYVR